MSLADEIRKLEDLRRDGVLTEDEFAQGKARLLREDSLGKKLQQGLDSPDERTWGLFIHLSQFLGYAVPILGWVAPIVIWQVMKEKSAIMDAHGIHITNWLISQFIYIIVVGLLSTIIIGIPFLIAAILMGVIYPIGGGLKAQNLEAWRYPLSIPFIGPRD